MKFSAPDYKVTCSDLSSGSVDVEGAEALIGGRKTEEIVAVSQADQTFLVAIDNRVLGSRLYMKRAGLDRNIHDYFSGISTADWSPGKSTAGYEIDEFTGGPKDSSHMDCIGFQREVSESYDGLGRIVVGVACSGFDRQRAYDALGKLQAPGG